MITTSIPITRVSRAIALVLFMILTDELVKAQVPEIQKSRQYVQSAVKAYKEKDYVSSRNFFLQAVELRPDHPTLLYNLSGVNALLGNEREAIGLLQRLAAMGLVYTPGADEDFTLLKKAQAFQSIVETFDRNRRPIGSPTIAYTLPSGDLIAEGLAYDPASETMFVGSVRKRQILSIGKDGVIKEFSREQDGLWGVFGMTVDPKTRVLWVCTAALPQMEGYTEGDRFRVAVCKYDLEKKTLLQKYELDDRAKPHHFGDLVLSPDGDVFISDSRSPHIYRISKRDDSLALFFESSSFASLQGLAFSPDGKTLLVADYSRGIFGIDMKTRQLSFLPPLPHATLLSIDGLYRHGKNLIAIQNDIRPRRIVRLIMSEDFRSILRLETVNANHPEYSDPTLGVVVGDDLFYNANGQWEVFDDKGMRVEGAGTKAHVIFRTAL